ncbi:MAG TPA: hypothetical protein VG246_13035 [Acidimicrobiales bacterium]|jgi:hypothetical protein|nr:hypothetical protein [Acidimicrobiales bacterium]
MGATQTIEKIGYPELCGRCDRTVAKVKTRKGKTMVMDFYPASGGWFTIVAHSSDGSPIVGRIPRGKPLDPDLPRFSCHFDTCPKRARRPKGKTSWGHGLTGSGAAGAYDA